LQEQNKALEEKEASLRASLAIERAIGDHFDRMAAFWQDCEVAKPNKPVPVPRKNQFSSFRKTKQNICL